MELHLLLIFMIVASILAVEIRDLLSSVVAVSAVGLALSLAFLILKAPNLAITQLVVEILCLIILIRATINKDMPLVISGRWFFNTVATVLFIVCFLFFGYIALKELPAFGTAVMGPSSSEYLASGHLQTKATNIVTAITLGFRSLDALIEAMILFAGILGVLVITRKTGKTHSHKDTEE